MAASGSGALNITGGGRVESSFGILGRELFSTGTVNVDGPGSEWINSSSLVVGDLGLGTLNITGGGKVQSAHSDVGLDNGSGEVTVDGAGSEWIVSGELNLGWEEPGTLDITAGGSVLVSDGLTIGRLATGDLNIRTGGRVESSFGIVGDELFSTGTVNVDGPGSEWINSSGLDVGDLGLGTLNITGGGKVQSARSRVGLDDPGSGVVTVDGSGSEWIVSRELIVGDEGPGTLDITAGGSILVTDKLTIGSVHTGTLNITGGGRIESSSGSFGNELSSTGTVNVDGPGSEWTNSGSLDIGDLGLGTLNITGGGKVQSASSRVGLDDPGSGVVTVDGSGSEWIVSGELKLGVEGFGTLDITAGGSVVSNTNAFIGSGPFSISTATVAGAAPNGAGSNWTIGGRLSIGGDAPAGLDGGTGTLKIQPGGSVSIGVSQDIALFPGGLLKLEGGTLSTPQIDFQGGGTFDWTSGTLHVGLFGGTLTVPNGGILAPGNSAGRTDVHGDYRQQAGAILAMEIGGTAASILYDTLFVSGNAVLGGNLQLSMLDGFIPTPVDTFFIFQASNPFGPTSVTGSFANVAHGQRLTTSDGIGSFVVNYGAGSPFNPLQIVLSAFQVTPIPGDYNQNGIVDAADYTVWRNNLGSGTSLANDDTPGVGPDDYTRWRTHFGQTAGSGAGANVNAAVPEPATALLMVLAAAGVSRRQRLRASRVSILLSA